MKAEQYIWFSALGGIAFMGVPIVMSSWNSIYWTFKYFTQPTHVYNLEGQEPSSCTENKSIEIHI